MKNYNYNLGNLKCEFLFIIERQGNFSGTKFKVKNILIIEIPSVKLCINVVLINCCPNILLSLTVKNDFVKQIN